MADDIKDLTFEEIMDYLNQRLNLLKKREQKLKTTFNPLGKIENKKFCKDIRHRLRLLTLGTFPTPSIIVDSDLEFLFLLTLREMQRIAIVWKLEGYKEYKSRKTLEPFLRSSLREAIPLSGFIREVRKHPKYMTFEDLLEYLEEWRLHLKVKEIFLKQKRRKLILEELFNYPEKLTIKKLRDITKTFKVKGYSKKNKEELINYLLTKLESEYKVFHPNYPYPDFI